MVDRVSVAVCAYTMSRWDQTGAALRSAAAQRRRPDEILLVIDHNDDLAARARSELTRQIDGLVVLDNEGRPGLSGARNTALAAAAGDVVCFLDDDAQAVDDRWLERLLEPYADPLVVGVGGTARPVWPAGSARPSTLPLGPHGRGVLDWVIGCSFPGQPTQPGPVRNLMGCNMSLRRQPALAAGGFCESLGRVGKTPLGCEETELCIRLGQAGGQLRLEPEACVDHQVAADRLTWSYLRRRGYAEGLSKAAVSGLVGSGDALSTERSYVTRVLPAAVGRGLRGLAVGPGRVEQAGNVVAVGLCLAATAAGYLRGRVSQAGRSDR